MEVNKEFSLDMLEEIEKEFEEQEEITLKIKTANGEKTAKLTIDKFFTPKKIKACVMELIQKIDILKNYVKQESETELYKLWMMLLLVKHFTTLDIPKEFKKQLAVIEKLTESTVLFQIFSAFRVEEVEKVMSELDKQTHIITAKVEAYEPLLKEVKADFQ
jgi:hypothetical protein